MAFFFGSGKKKEEKKEEEQIDTTSYEMTLELYQKKQRMFPYHMSDVICKVMRITPFDYYHRMIFDVMKAEKSYDTIPNFTAADILRYLSIGRNEFIALMNQARAMLMWRVNRTAAKDLLPTAPADATMDGWWTVGLVNLSGEEMKRLLPEESAVVQAIAQSGGVATIHQLETLAPAAVVRGLYRRGYLYIDVPVRPTDRITIPLLEGFVSNRDANEEKEAEEQLAEALLYSIFIASSDRETVAELAVVLQKDLSQVLQAVSLACRLGFAKRLDGGATGSGGRAAPAGTDGGAAGRRGVALVVDSELTSFLMMGSLSPGLKKHAVTLFEGGKMRGDDIAEFIHELSEAVKAPEAREFEHFFHHAQSLRDALKFLGRWSADAASGGLDILRIESLAALPAAIRPRVLQRDYAVIIPIAPLQAPPLPLRPDAPGPAHFGMPCREATTPWLHLLLYVAAGAGLPALALIRGLRLRVLPPPLRSCGRALLWSWDGASGGPSRGAPLVVPSTALLLALNGLLRRSAVLVQPLPPAGADEDPALPPTCYVPLPLPSGGTAGAPHDGNDAIPPAEAALVSHPAVTKAVDALKLQHSVGYLRLVRTANGADDTPGGGWALLGLQLGMPLFSPALSAQVCADATRAALRERESLQAHKAAMALLRRRLQSLVKFYGTRPAEGDDDDDGDATDLDTTAGPPPPPPPPRAWSWNDGIYDAEEAEGEPEDAWIALPAANLYFDGASLAPYDLASCVQGRTCLQLQRDRR